MYIRLHVKYPLFLWDFNETIIFSIDFEKKTQIANFIKKIRQVEAKLLHADGWMDRRTVGYTYIRKLVFAVLRLSFKTP
jgi:hypothetical protein